MSGTKPTLDEYFARARRDGVPEAESTLDLLSEYKTKAERQRRRRRAAVVTAFSFLFLGAIGFEFTMRFPSAPGGSLATTPHSTTSAGSAAAEQPAQEQSGSAVSGAISVPGTALPVSPQSGRTAQTFAATAQHGSRSGSPAGGRQNARQVSSPAEADEAAIAESVSAPYYDAIAVSSAALRVPAVAYPEATGQTFIAPPDDYNELTFGMAVPTQKEQHTLALTVGARYGTAASDISPINEQLAELDFPMLRSQYQQTTVQAGIAIGNATIGVAYTSPYTETVTGTHKLSYAVANIEPPTVATTFAHKRWSTFGEYSFAITDDLRLDAGAQVSFTSYELGFESNYKPPLALNPNQEGDGESDLWTGMWNNVSAPDISSNFDEKVWRDRPVGGISTRSVGISPTVGLSWRALPALSLQCRVGYMFNIDHEWRMNTTGAAVTGIKNQLRMDEYSISIGASFYQWLF